MNIVWVEDFGGTQPLPANSKTLIPLFQGILSREIFVKKWDDDDDLLANTKLLSDFFSEHSIHQILLLKNVFDYLDQVESQDIARHDVFVIDINLTQGVDLERALPDGMEEIKEKPTFHRKAGFFIYNNLIRLGVPAENICLLTGEQGSTAEFNTHCRDSLTPRPIAFEKSDSGYTAFRGWLGNHQANDYLALRRAVIEGCDFLKCNLGNSPVIQFQIYIESEAEEIKQQGVTTEEMNDYLDTLRVFFPAKPPLDDVGRSRLLRLFVRALAHEWENRARPENPGRVTSTEPIDKRLLPALGWVMKNVRNWMSHNNLVNELGVADAAYLFIVNMRAMFRWPYSLEKHEKLLLNIIRGGKDESITSLAMTEITKGLVLSYSMVRDRVREYKTGESRYFSSMVNNLALINAPFNYVQALHLMLLHGLVDVGSSHKARVDRFLVSRDVKSDFLYQLVCAIYPRCFKQ